MESTPSGLVDDGDLKEEEETKVQGCKILTQLRNVAENDQSPLKIALRWYEHIDVPNHLDERQQFALCQQERVYKSQITNLYWIQQTD